MSLLEELKTEVIPLLAQLNKDINKYKESKPSDYARLFAIWKDTNLDFCVDFSGELAKLIILSIKEENDINKTKIYKHINKLTESVYSFSQAPNVSEEAKKDCQKALEKFTVIENAIPAHLKAAAIEKKI